MTTVQLALVLAAVSIGWVAGRIAVVASPEGDTAFLSANDRSRWATVASLVEDGSYAIDRTQSITATDRHGKTRHPWQTIDRVMHVGDDGRVHHYSSKPTLFPTMVAGVYWVTHRLTGLRMTDHPVYVPRLVLALTNLPMLAFFLWATWQTMTLAGASDVVRLVGLAVAGTATMATPFWVSLNNHSLGVTATAAAVWGYLTLVQYSPSPRFGEEGPGFHLLRISQLGFGLGLAAAVGVVAELPALSMFCLWGVLAAWVNLRAVPGFLLAAAVVAAAGLGTNFLAHDSWRTPYAHRSHGEVVETFNSGNPPADLQVIRALPGGGWEAHRTAGGQITRFAIDPPDDSGTQAVRIWDDWYDYPGSYWREPGRRRGVDLGEPSRAVYLVHTLVGHHGILSLTPFWLLVPFGWGAWLSAGAWPQKRLAAAVILTTAVCLAFYVARPLIDRNYGGVSVALRWMVWCVPLWLWSTIPAIEAMRKSAAGRWTLAVLIAASVFSVSASLRTPWQSPWLYRLGEYSHWWGG